MTCNINYNIVSTGSKGNAVVINKFLLIDCGVPFKQLGPFYRDLKLVLLTHIHSDHFNRTTIRKLANERPLLRWACCRWLVSALVECNVEPANIDILECGIQYDYGIVAVEPVKLTHNVPNCGYKLFFKRGGKLFYATDTNSLSGITATNFDLYMVEANHEEAEIKERIKEKKAAGLYAYEMQAVKNHLSKEKCDNWIYSNIGPTGSYIYLHNHVDDD